MTDFLADLTNAYSSLLAFEALTDGFTDDGRRPRYRGWRRDLLIFDPDFGPLGFGLPAVPSLAEVRRMVPASEQLILAKVQLASPGVWEFLGSLNPLEVLRKYLCDRHDRAKDRDYRSAAEQRRLDLENAALETKVIRERIEALRAAGATDRDLAPLVNTLLREPLARLEGHQARGLISHAEIVPPEEPPSGDERYPGQF